jgi:hypothetical protein
MIEWERIQTILGVLDRIRPTLQADGVGVELLEVNANNARPPDRFVRELCERGTHHASGS